MARMAVCPRNHVWPLDEAAAAAICPHCGLGGRPRQDAADDTTCELDTLAPAAIPPQVPHLSVALSDPVRHGVEQIRKAFASVPGYVITRELGRGGMGVIYEAEEVELKRPVALKVLRVNTRSDPHLQRRFRHEAEAVASLRHRGIVQIYAVGEHQGYPYLALEYVEGGTLAQRIAGRTLPPGDAARVVEALARTMHFAHQRAIVHRDLKPANVLLAPAAGDEGMPLGGEGRFEPKITDFGLAKATSGDSQQTRTGAILGTPSYMAPEQARGASDQVGPAADIYALGAVLYELLTGRPPFLAETRVDTLAQVVRQEPLPPATLRPGLPRDLETICLKCLRKEPAQRYASAAELADDLHRYLQGEPIRARPVSWWERGWKLARRRPTEAALLSLLALTVAGIVAGVLAYSTWLRAERDRAEHNFRLAMRAVNDLLTEIGEDHLAGEPYMEEKRRVLLEKALHFYEEFLREKHDDRRVRLETALAFRRLADVLRLLERHEEALGAYAQAVNLLESLPAGHEILRETARCWNARGEVLRAANRFADAEAACGQALHAYDDLLRDVPNDPDARREQAQARNNLGILYRESHRPAQAEAAFRSALGQLQALADAHPDVPVYRQHLARVHINLATVLDPPRHAEAVKSNETAVALLEALHRAHPARPEYQHELGVACNNLGNTFAGQDRFADAKARHEQARDRFQGLSSDFPRVLLYRQELANSWNSIGSACLQMYQPDQAVRAWEQAAALLEKLIGERPRMAAYHGDRGMVLGNLGLAHLAGKRLPEARTFLQRGIEGLREALRLNPEHAIYRDILHDHTRHLCDVLFQTHDYAAALAAVRAASQLSPESPAWHYDAARLLARGITQMRQDGPAGRRADLETAYAEEALARLRHALNKGYEDLQQFQVDRQGAFAALAERPAFVEITTRLTPPVRGAPR